MRSTVLLTVYLLVFIAQIVLLVLSLRKRTGILWLSLFLSEIIPMFAAIILMRYFDTLPGYGVMPGLTYFAEALFSMGASVLYAGGLCVSLLIFLIVKMLEKKQRKKKGEVR